MVLKYPPYEAEEEKKQNKSHWARPGSKFSKYQIIRLETKSRRIS